MHETFNYQRYLASREWAILRRAVIARARDGKECERCSARSDVRIVAAVHHLTYERIGHELLTDLQGVCRPCHDWLGGFSDIDPCLLYLRWSVDHARENGWTDMLDELKARAVAWELEEPRPPRLRTWLRERQEAQDAEEAPD